MLTLNYNIDVLATTDDNVGDLIEFWKGQCHHFIVTGGNAHFTFYGGNPFHRAIVREEGP